MRFALVLLIAVTWCVLSVFVIRHHRPKPDSFRKTTLGGIYREFLQEAPTLLKPRKLSLFFLGLSAIFGAFYPVVLIAGIRAGGGQGLFLVGGVIALVGAAMNLILIVLSHTNFMGGSSTCKEQTVLTWLLPLSQTLVAVASVIIGFSSRWVSEVCGFVLR